LPNGSWPELRDSLSAQYAELEIAGQTISAFNRLFVVAEIGLNHGGSLDRALALVDAAADAGASAVKFQTLDASSLVAPDAPAPMHVDAGSMRDFFATFELDEAAHQRLVDRARSRGLIVMATPFSEASVDMLVRVGVDAFKIASGDITFTSLIARSARTRKPLVMSTGMSSLVEIEQAVRSARASGATQVALLHCVSTYPVPAGHENLRAITTLSQAFGTPVGWSDHSADGAALPLAVALGVSIYERHLILERGDGSIDEPVSSTPEELAALIAAAAAAQGALGSGHKSCAPVERGNKLASRRALYAARSLRVGDVIADADIIALRPAIGIAADRAGELIGRRVERDVDAGTAFLEIDVHAPVAEVDRVA
jgi:sialic acid synthase SpsE